MFNQGDIIASKYEVIEKIGAGGMAIVYKVKNLKSQNIVALKVMRDEFSDNEKFIEKFRAEADAELKLNHRNVINVYSIGTVDNIHYIEMEYVNGENLKEYINKNKNTPIKECLEIIINIADALAYAHENGIVHKDVKAQNILLSKDNEIKVADFGISTVNTASTLSKTCNIIGSVHYFSPEQAKGEHIDERSDIYSFGIVMYELLTNKLPFDAENPIAVALKHVTEEIVNPQEYNCLISDELKAVVLKCTQKNRVDRYTNILEVIEDLHKEYEIEIIRYNNKKKEEEEKRMLLQKQKEEAKKKERKESREKRRKEKYIAKSNKPKSVKKEEEIASTQDKKTIHSRKDSNDKIKNKRKVYKSFEEEDREKRKVFAMAVLTSILIIGFLVYIAYGPVKGYIDSKVVLVPNLVGMKYEDASKVMEEKGVKLEKVDSVFSEDIGEGRITVQDIDKNSRISKDSVIKVLVSLGSCEVTMPNVIGKKYVPAKEILLNKNLRVEIKTIDNTQYEVGTVVLQEPKSGTVVDRYTNVVLYASMNENGKLPAEAAINDTQNIEPVEKTNVPKLVGLNFMEAKLEINSAKLKVGSIRRQFSQEYDKDIVMEQSIEQGQSVDVNTKVDMLVSMGDETKPVINMQDKEPVENQDNQTDTNKPDANVKPSTPVNTTPISKIELTINPLYNSDKENMNVKIVTISNSTPKLIYNKNHNKTEFPFKHVVEGEKGTIIKLYLDDKLQIEDSIK